MRKNLACVALASLTAMAFASASLAAGVPQPTAETVERVLRDQMGVEAKDLKAEVEMGVVKLHGWVKGPRELDQARYIASKIPGVARAYGSSVHTWATTDK